MGCVGYLRDLHRVLEGGSEGDADGGEAHEETGLCETWVQIGGHAGEGHRHRAQFDVLGRAVGWDGAGRHRQGEDAGGAQRAIGFQADRLIGDPDEDGGNTKAVLGHEVLGKGWDLVTRRLSNDGAH